MAQKPKGFVLYQGPSKLDGKPIVVIATLETSNAKTGNMVQTWILRSDVAPVEAMKSGEDVSICGVCPQRRSIGGACYVNVGQAPRAVYEAFKRGAYPVCLYPELEDAFAGRAIRIGAYGDPAAVPTSIWKQLTANAASWTGYTHQASHKAFDPELLQFVMVSCETPKQALAAQAKGYRTFRIKSADAPALAGEIECLSDAVGKTCEACGLCKGANAATNVYINVHGSLAGRYESKYRTINLRAA